MTKDVIIGLDAGTSVIKAVAFDPDGEEIASASRPNATLSRPGGGVEQDMEATWTAAAEVLLSLGEKVDGLARRTRVLAVTGQGDGTWLIDAEGRPVHDGWLWLDARAGAVTRELAASEAARTVYRVTCTGLNTCQMRTQLLWMKRNAPDLIARASTAFHCKDWLYFRLTGVRATDPTEGVFTFGNPLTRDYDDDVIAALELADERRLLPPILDGSREAHALGGAAAAATGLPAGLPVVLGYVDVMCTAIGAGLHDAAASPGLSVVGSTGMHMRFVPDASALVPNADESGYAMAFPGKAYAQMQTNMAATLNIDWALDLAREALAAEGVERSRGDLLAGLDERIAAARPGAALFHPYVSAAGERGPFTDSDARASFTGIDSRTGWADMLRAVYDGLALAARDCYAAMGEIPGEIRLGGGAIRSTALRGALAAALGRPVRTVARVECGAAGAAMIAAVQQGEYADIAEATKAWVAPRLCAPEAPAPDLVPVYDALYAAYRATREALVPAWTAMADMRAVLEKHQ